jgi:hypothetical protein
MITASADPLPADLNKSVSTPRSGTSLPPDEICQEEAVSPIRTVNVNSKAASYSKLLRFSIV